jgi:hypothetical protein
VPNGEPDRQPPREPRPQREPAGERVRAVADLAAEIRARPCAGPVRMVAVDGPGRSGKSTLAHALAAACGEAPVVRVDDFLYWHDIQGWWPRLEHEALRPLLSGSPARFRVRDWAGDPLGQGLAGWAEVRPAEVVIVEGITASRQAIAADLALALWVTAPRAQRLRRAAAREGPQRLPLWIEWMRLEDEFFAADGAERRAAHIVSGAPAIRCDPATEAVLIGPR